MDSSTMAVQILYYRSAGCSYAAEGRMKSATQRSLTLPGTLTPTKPTLYSREMVGCENAYYRRAMLCTGTPDHSG